MSDYHAKELGPEDLEKWDRFVKSSPQGTLYHTSMWKRYIDQSNPGARYGIFGVFDGAEILAGCTGLVRKRLGMETLVVPLLTPYTGFLLSPPAGSKVSDTTSRNESLLQELAAYLGRFRYQNVSCAPPFCDARPLTCAGYTVAPRYTYEIDLQIGVDQLLANMDGHVRRNIKKAQGAGFDLSDQIDVAQAFEIYSHTMTKNGGTCPVSQFMFDEMANGSGLAEKRRIVAASKDGRLQSFIILTHYAGTISYTLAATAADAIQSGISSLLVWTALSESVGQFTTFDFVGANIPSIARFKAGFNPALRSFIVAEKTTSTTVKMAKLIKSRLRKG